MPDYLFLMHDDASDRTHDEVWGPYLAKLRTSGHLQGGSAIGVGMCVRKAGQAPAMLSGGQRQRLAIARALINDPTVLLADEPTGALDSAGGEEVLELFRRLHTDGQTIVMVTHSVEVAAGASRLVTMQDGQVIDAGRAEGDLRPESPTTG